LVSGPTRWILTSIVSRRTGALDESAVSGAVPITSPGLNVRALSPPPLVTTSVAESAVILAQRLNEPAGI
jgi:hypothetical protein